jgi:hypothetical protein
MLQVLYFIISTSRSMCTAPYIDCCLQFLYFVLFCCAAEVMWKWFLDFLVSSIFTGIAFVPKYHMRCISTVKLFIIIIIIIIIIILNLFSPVSYQAAVFCKSRSQQEIKAIYPITYQCCVQSSLVWSSVATWPTDDLGTTEGSDLNPLLFLMLQL